MKIAEFLNITCQQVWIAGKLQQAPRPNFACADEVDFYVYASKNTPYCEPQVDGLANFINVGFDVKTKMWNPEFHNIFTRFAPTADHFRAQMYVQVPVGLIDSFIQSHGGIHKNTLNHVQAVVNTKTTKYFEALIDGGFSDEEAMQYAMLPMDSDFVTPNLPNERQAFIWLHARRPTRLMNNYRIANISDAKEVNIYKLQYASDCANRMDFRVKIGGNTIIIGSNCE